MKICPLKNIAGGEILAKAIYTDDYTELLAKGVVLKKEYIPRLQELGIKDIYIEETDLEREKSEILVKEVREDIKNKVQSILEKYTYQQNKELMELCTAADNIIENVLNEGMVAEKVYDIKERSADIYEHSISVCSFATLLGLKLGIKQNKIRDMAVASLLHDLGLRYLPFDYKNKNMTDMSEMEQIEYKKHTIYGYSSVASEDWISKASKNIILHHHEILDGTGYPLHLKTISQECRIVTVCDIFDEMICGIGCKRAKVYEAVELLKLYAGTKLDIEIVKLFLKFIAVYPVGTMVVTNEGETATVVRQNKNFPERPVIKILKDGNGNEISNEVIKDLMENHKIFIEQVLN